MPGEIVSPFQGRVRRVVVPGVPIASLIPPQAIMFVTFGD